MAARMDLEARPRQEPRERLRRARWDEGIVPPREDERRGADPRRALARVVPEAGVGLGGETARRHGCPDTGVVPEVSRVGAGGRHLLDAGAVGWPLGP